MLRYRLLSGTESLRMHFQGRVLRSSILYIELRAYAMLFWEFILLRGLLRDHTYSADLLAANISEIVGTPVWLPLGTP